MRTKTPCAVALLVALHAHPAHADPPCWLDRDVVDDLTRRATRRARLDDDDLRALASRARAAAWLPRVTVRVARGFGASSSQSLSAQPERVGTDDSLTFDVRASFDLDRALFDPREVELLRMSAQRAAQRRELELAVVELLASLEALRRAGPLPPEDPRALERMRLRARLEQLAGALP